MRSSNSLANNVLANNVSAARCLGFTALARRLRAALFGVAAVLAVSSQASAATSACPASKPRHLELPATWAALAAGRPITIVAFGSSSTEGAGATTPAHAYPARLQAILRAAWPKVPVTVLNRGLGGQTTDAMLARLDTDVLAAHPTLVIWQDGANAALRGMEPARFAALLSEGVRRVVASGADLVLMDNQVAPRLEQTAHHATFIATVAHEAAARRVPLFSRAALMREWHAADPAANDMIGADGLHHTDRGYECLAEALGRAILAPVSPAIMTAQGKRD